MQIAFPSETSRDLDPENSYTYITTYQADCLQSILHLTACVNTGA